WGCWPAECGREARLPPGGGPGRCPTAGSRSWRRTMTDPLALIEPLDLRAEIARAQAELIVFRKECLPAFLGGPVQDFLADGMSEWLQGHIVAVAGRLSEWQDAALRLAEYLPLGPLPSDAPTLDRNDFDRFLFQGASPAFVSRGGRIAWRIELFMPLD